MAEEGLRYFLAKEGSTQEKPELGAEVASEGEAHVDVTLHGGVQDDPFGRLELVLARLLSIEAKDGSDLPGDSDQHVQRRTCLVGAAVGEDGCRPGRLHGSTPRAADSRSATPPRAASAIQMKVSRFPLGPGRPELA